MGPFATRVYDVLQAHTVSPWNVLKVECGWRGIDPLRLEPLQLEMLVPRLIAHVARMTDEENGRDLQRALEALLDSAESSDVRDMPVPIVPTT